MRKIIKTALSKGVSVKIDLIEFQKLFGDRIYELTDQLTSLIAERCFRKYGINPHVTEKLSYIEIYSDNINPEHYGYIQKEVDLIESELLAKLGKSFHYISMFYSKEKLEPIKLAIYRVKETRIGESILYKALGLACWYFRRSGLECVPLGRKTIGIVTGEFAEHIEQLEASIELGEIKFAYKGFKVLDFKDKRDKLAIKKLIDYRIKEIYASKGYIIDGLHVYEKKSIVDDPQVIVRPGVEIQTYIFDNGRFSIALSPRYSIEARGTLSDMKCEKEKLIGTRVRRITDNLSGKITGVKGNLFEVSIGGLVLLEKGDNLVKIYDIRELKTLGISKEVISLLRMNPAKWSAYISEFISPIRSFEVANQNIRIICEMSNVETL